MLLNLLFSFLISLSSKATSTQTMKNLNCLTSAEWKKLASDHSIRMTNLLYPTTVNDVISDKSAYALANRNVNAIRDHPIYNFLHRYYDFSFTELKKFSPGKISRITLYVYFNIYPLGLNVLLEDVTESDLTSEGSLSLKYLQKYNEKYFYYNSNLIPAYGMRSKNIFQNVLNILKGTINNKMNLKCYGLHEWAMLYNGTNGIQSKHQSKLPLRVSLQDINEVVESHHLCCSHFDAWRFFHKDIQSNNLYSPMTRKQQNILEQSACIHATMDLFKYSYYIYPLIPSSLLQKSIEIALAARYIDMRASPYDVSMYAGCESPICIETIEGKRQYVLEQMELSSKANPLRQELIYIYEQILNYDLK